MFDVLAVAAVLVPFAALAAAIGGWMPDVDGGALGEPGTKTGRTFAGIKGGLANDQPEA